MRSTAHCDRLLRAIELWTRVPGKGPQGRTVPSVAVILLVEDDSGIRSALSRALTERGHAVHWQPAGLPGLQSVIDDRPDVVLLDLGLPDVEGVRVLTMMRSVSDVPVIVVTARDDDADIVKALDAGADDFVTKPFGADHLEARIRAVLRPRRSPRGGGRSPSGTSWSTPAPGRPPSRAVSSNSPARSSTC